jgi:ABC-type branched-subunit amino acid transport system ATPase component
VAREGVRETPLQRTLRLERVSLSFGGVQAIRDLSFVVPAGSICGLIGPNGAGKTSVLNVISRFYQPQHGVVFYGQTDILRLRPYEVIAHNIGRSFQNVALFKELSVLDNLLLGVDHQSRAGLVQNTLRLPAARRHERAARARAAEVLDFLEIAHLRGRRAGELAFGDQKLVDMGRALMARPTLLLLDEPAAGLPDTRKTWLADVIRRIPHASGATVLLIDHDMGLVLGVSSHVVVMEYGAKIAEGTPAAIRANPRVLDAYLGTE